MPLRKSRYYDIAHLLIDYPNAYYYVAFGERSNGKTYSALDYALTRYFQYGEQFAYIRRFGQDIKKKNLQTLLAAHVDNGRILKLSNNRFSLVDYTGGKFVAYNYDEQSKKMQMDTQPIGYAFDLNAMEHHKSTSYPKVTTIIFDEFLSRQGYLLNEFVLFMNTLSTIIRDRENVKIFMIGNTVNKYCPYFQEMGLTHIKEQQPGTTDVYTYADSGLSVVVEYCDPISKKGGKKSDVYFAFDNPQLKMITAGAWEIAIYPHLDHRYRPMDVIAEFFIEFDKDLLHCDIVVTNEEYYIFVHPKTTPIKEIDADMVYTSIPNGKWNYKVGITNQVDNLSKTILRLLSENRVFYANNETGEIMRNYIMWSTQYSATKGGN